MTLNALRPNRLTSPDLKGQPIPQDKTKIAQTPSHSIQLSSEIDNSFVPDFKITTRTITDPNPRENFFAEPENTLLSFSQFKDLFHRVFEANKSYLFPQSEDFLTSLPETDRTHFAMLNISGRRAERFFDEAMRLVERSALSMGDKTKARQDINLTHRQAFFNRDIEFDRANTGSYWGYTSDHVFVHVFEALLASLPASDPKRAFYAKQIDHILTHQFTPFGEVDEYNIEESLSLIAIDPKSRHRISLTLESDSMASAKHELLKLPKGEGRPTDRYVFRDKQRYFFEDDQTQLNDDLVTSLARYPISDVVFRRIKSEEKPRADFRYNWQQNGLLTKEKIKTGWWGFCDIKATLQSILADMPKCRGILEYRSDTNKVSEFDRTLLLEALAALLNLGGNYGATDGTTSTLEEYQSGGRRYYGRPDELVIKTNQTSVAIPIQIQSLSLRNGSGAANLDLLFSTHLPDRNCETFAKNPHLTRVENETTNFIEINDRSLGATVNKGGSFGYTFDRNGQLVESKDPFVLNPLSTGGDRVLIATKLVDLKCRKLERYYYCPDDGTLKKVLCQFIKEDNQYIAKEEETEISLGEVINIELGRERVRDDDPMGKMKLLQEAIRSGEKIACDSDPSEKVWNGDVYRAKIETEWVSHDRKWERLRISLDATFGTGKQGVILNKLNDEGQVIESCEVTPVVDFFWKSRPRIAPLVTENGKSFINKTMSQRGLLKLDSSLAGTLGALQDLNDLIYLGFSAKDNKPLYTIVHDGTRLVYQDKDQWKSDIQKIQSMT